MQRKHSKSIYKGIMSVVLQHANYKPIHVVKKRRYAQYTFQAVKLKKQ